MISPLFTLFCRNALLATSLIACARASVLLDTGNVTFSPTGTQFGRISRDGASSTWGSPKPFPGVTGAPAARGYETFTVNSGIFPFLQISIDDPTAGLFVAAYLNSFNPVNSAPNYGLDINYLGDPGNTLPFGNPSFFQIQVATHTTIVLPVNEVNPGGGSGRPFDLLVEGFLDSSFGDVAPAPEPAAFGLLAAGLAVLVAVRARVSGCSLRRQL